MIIIELLLQTALAFFGILAVAYSAPATGGFYGGYAAAPIAYGGYAAAPIAYGGYAAPLAYGGYGYGGLGYGGLGYGAIGYGGLGYGLGYGGYVLKNKWFLLFN